MRRAEIGSRPENGSSQSRMSGLRDDGARQRRALDHAAGELAGQQRRRRRRGRRRRALSCTRVGDLGLAQARALAQREGEVVEDGHRVEQRAALEQHAELARARAYSWRSESRVMSSPSTRMLPGQRLDQPADQAQQRCSCPSRCRRGSPRSCRAGKRNDRWSNTAPLAERHADVVEGQVRGAAAVLRVGARLAIASGSQVPERVR